MNGRELTEGYAPGVHLIAGPRGQSTAAVMMGAVEAFLRDQKAPVTIVADRTSPRSDQLNARLQRLEEIDGTSGLVNVVHLPRDVTWWTGGELRQVLDDAVGSSLLVVYDPVTEWGVRWPVEQMTRPSHWALEGRWNNCLEDQSVRSKPLERPVLLRWRAPVPPYDMSEDAIRRARETVAAGRRLSLSDHPFVITDLTWVSDDVSTKLVSAWHNMTVVLPTGDDGPLVYSRTRVQEDPEGASEGVWEVDVDDGLMVVRTRHGDGDGGAQEKGA